MKKCPHLGYLKGKVSSTQMTPIARPCRYPGGPSSLWQRTSGTQCFCFTVTTHEKVCVKRSASVLSPSPKAAREDGFGYLASSKHSKKFIACVLFLVFGFAFFFLNLKFLGYCEVLHLNQMGLNCFSRDVKPKITEETSPHAP